MSLNLEEKFKTHCNTQNLELNPNQITLVKQLDNFYKENYAADLSTKYSQLTKEELEDQNISDISIAGRIVLRRVMGNASFATIRDASGDIQIYISKNTVEKESYEDFKTWDLGDIVGIKGKLFKTRTDELTIEASEAVLITKAVRPMPDKFKGLADIEIKSVSYTHLTLPTKA